MCMFSAEVDKATLCFLVSTLLLQSALFAFYLVPGYFAFLCFVLVILPFKMAPKDSVEVLSSILKYKKAVMFLPGKICVFG